MSDPVVYSTVSAARAACDTLRAEGHRLGLVPTMGALHAGHLALIDHAKTLADRVMVSIFVNPTQFGPGEDFSRYPRMLEKDVEQCARRGVDLVFAPDALEMYPEGERTRVHVAGLTESLCGASRPGHFDGVATIVTKLFAVAGPCTAVFGRKDYQQLKVIQRMARDLLLPVRVVGHPTVREPDGLALSSRNQYLSEAERQMALAIPRGLRDANRAFDAGERNSARLRGGLERALESAGLRIDYVSVADPETLEPFSEAVPERALLAVAVFAGSTRLIDNMVLGEERPPLFDAA